MEGAFGEKARRSWRSSSASGWTTCSRPESGQLARELERLFGAESSVAVQHQLRTVMAEASARMREDLLKQFSSADAHNPLADFKAGTVSVLKRAAEQQDVNLRALNEQIAGLKAEVVKLQAERDKAVEVAAEHARSTAKGRPYEEAVVEAIDEIATARGDACDARRRPAGRRRPARRRAGRRRRLRRAGAGADRVRGQERSRLEEPRAGRAGRGDGTARRRLRRLGRRERGAAPGRVQQLREVSGDKLFVAYDPEDGSRLALEVAYSLARARVLMAKAGGDKLDAGALRTEVERALGAMEDVRRIKTQLTSAAGGIEQARALLDGMAERVRGHLARLDALVAAAPGGEPAPQQRLV